MTDDFDAMLEAADQERKAAKESPGSSGLPATREEELDRLTRQPDVLLDAELVRLLHRERVQESQLAHTRRRLARVRHERRRRYASWNPYDAPGHT
jgi:hypothetical protein